MLAYLRIPIFTLHLVLRLGWLIVTSPFVKDKEKKMFRQRSRWARESARILGIQAHWHGNTTDLPPGLYVSNHRSIIDPVILLRKLHVYPLSKAEISANPLMALASKQTGVILVDRDQKDSRKAALEEIKVRISTGASILVFPEGTTSNEKYTLPFRKGSILATVEYQLPIIPIVLVYPGSDYHWEGGSMLSHFVRQFKNPTSVVHVAIGKPKIFPVGVDPTDELESWMKDRITDLRARQRSA